jgi:hypothetical protein
MAEKTISKESDVKYVSVSQLLLDEDNPRLPSSVVRDQQSMLDYIADTTAIEELMDAIAENGFFPGEPLIVVKHKTKKDSYTVVEGNRRLTALMLLQDPANCSNSGVRMREIAKRAKHKTASVPIVECPNRKGVLPYLGFRHITGIKQWEPLAKARYIEQLFGDTDKNAEPKARYSEVARAIGSRQDHIKRNLDALSVYNVIEGKDFYGIDGLTEESIKFAVLSTAIADNRIGSFIGVSKKVTENDFASQDPIVNREALKEKEIAELTRWLYEKNEKGKTKVGESRNLRELSAVVDSPRALEAFRRGSPLKIAYQQTGDLIKDFLGLLYQSEGSLSEAAGMVATVNYDEDAYNVARRILENIRLIGRELQEKRNADEDSF